MAVTTENFNVSNPSGAEIAYEFNNSTTTPPDPTGVSATEFTTTAYSNIHTDDTTYYTSGSGTSLLPYRVNIFKFPTLPGVISTDLRQLDFTWTGYTRQGNLCNGWTNNGSIYIWRTEQGVGTLWVKLADITDAAVAQHVYQFTSDFNFILKSGFIYFAVVENVGYAGGTITESSQIISDYCELIITDSSGIKTVLGVPIASVKTYNGVAIASVKRINGILV